MVWSTVLDIGLWQLEQSFIDGCSLCIVSATPLSCFCRGEPSWTHDISSVMLPCFGMHAACLGRRCWRSRVGAHTQGWWLLGAPEGGLHSSSANRLRGSLSLDPPGECLLFSDTWPHGGPSTFAVIPAPMLLGSSWSLLLQFCHHTEYLPSLRIEMGITTALAITKPSWPDTTYPQTSPQRHLKPNVLELAESCHLRSDIYSLNIVFTVPS